MTTGLNTFDTTLQESNLWLKDLMDRLGTNDRHHAYSTLRVVLHVLRDRIGPENASHLGAQLPMLLRGLYYEGWHMTGTPTKERHEAQFLTRIRELLPQSDPASLKSDVCAVFDLLSKKVDRGEAVKIVSILPKELRELWPAFIQAAAEAKIAGAA